MGVIGLITLFVRIPPEDTLGVIGLIMLFVHSTRGHGGRYRVNNAIRTYPTRGHGGRYRVNNVISTSRQGVLWAL